MFPASGWTIAGPGNPAGKFVGWRPLTLPYIEQENLKELYDFDLNWWEGTNPTAGGVPVRTYQCPSVPQRSDVTSAIAKPPRPAMTFPVPIAATDYEAIMGVQPTSIDPVRYNAANRFSVMYRNSCSRMADVLDGTSMTIAIVECAARPLVYRIGRTDLTVSNDQGIGWVDSEGPFSLDGSNNDGTLEGCTRQWLLVFDQQAKQQRAVQLSPRRREHAVCRWPRGAAAGFDRPARHGGAMHSGCRRNRVRRDVLAASCPQLLSYSPSLQTRTLPSSSICTWTTFGRQQTGQSSTYS